MPLGSKFMGRIKEALGTPQHPSRPPKVAVMGRVGKKRKYRRIRKR